MSNRSITILNETIGDPYPSSYGDETRDVLRVEVDHWHQLAVILGAGLTTVPDDDPATRVPLLHHLRKLRPIYREKIRATVAQAPGGD